MDAVTGLNHVTLSVTDLERSLVFYEDLLGFQICRQTERSSYLVAGALWLALVVEDTRNFAVVPNGYSHIAFSVPATVFTEIKDRLLESGAQPWQESERENSFYFCDPDGHRLEIHSGDLASRLLEIWSEKRAQQVVTPSFSSPRNWCVACRCSICDGADWQFIRLWETRRPPGTIRAWPPRRLRSMAGCKRR